MNAKPGLIRSKQRVADHGEVFTPAWLVDDMIGLVRDEADRIDSRFLEPACGSGNFLVPVLRRKLAAAKGRYGRNDFEHRHFALLALMSVYGIELLADNLAECRANLIEVFAEHLGIDDSSPWYWAAGAVLTTNIVHGDALTMRTVSPPTGPITFAEWSYVGKGTYRRRDFRFDALTQAASYSQTVAAADDGLQGSLFEDLGKHEIFTPVRDHGSLTVEDIADGGGWREGVVP